MRVSMYYAIRSSFLLGLKNVVRGAHSGGIYMSAKSRSRIAARALAAHRRM